MQSHQNVMTKDELTRAVALVATFGSICEVGREGVSYTITALVANNCDLSGQVPGGIAWEQGGEILKLNRDMSFEDRLVLAEFYVNQYWNRDSANSVSSVHARHIEARPNQDEDAPLCEWRAYERGAFHGEPRIVVAADFHTAKALARQIKPEAEWAVFRVKGGDRYPWRMTVGFTNIKGNGVIIRATSQEEAVMLCRWCYLIPEAISVAGCIANDLT